MFSHHPATKNLMNKQLLQIVHLNQQQKKANHQFQQHKVLMLLRQPFILAKNKRQQVSRNQQRHQILLTLLDIPVRITSPKK